MQNEKSKQISKKQIVGIIIIVAIVATIVAVVAFFFSPKKYTYYINQDVDLGKLKAVSIDLYEEGTEEICIYDDELIEELLKVLDTVKPWPYCSVNGGNGIKGFSVEFLGKDNKSMSIYMSDCDYYYVGSFNLEDNGSYPDSPVWDMMGSVCIDKEDGERLYELVQAEYSENIRNIAVGDILKLSKDGVTDWKVFQQFKYVEADDVENIEKGDLISETPVYFYIEGKKGYVLVWYSDATVENEEGINHYDEVMQALVYDENGKSMDLYDEGIGEFMEVMN